FSSSFMILQKYLELFNYPEHYRGDLECVYIPHGVIMNRIECLARDILEDIGHHDLMVLCVLKGGYKFCSDLVESIKAQSRSANRRLTTRVEFIRFKSYLVRKHCNHKHNSQNYFCLIADVILHVLISSQAIVDTGKTMRALLQHVETFQPKMVKVYFRDLNVNTIRNHVNIISNYGNKLKHREKTQTERIETMKQKHLSK
uniref:Un-named sa821 n=1 Tax=Cyprinus carpio TaxID=7962 RepID=A0A8C2B022_CYPCA